MLSASYDSQSGSYDSKEKGLSNPPSNWILQFNYQSHDLLSSHMFLIQLCFYIEGGTFRQNCPYNVLNIYSY